MTKPTSGGNTAKLIANFIKEIAKVDDEMEPLKDQRKDLVAAAKDNGLNTIAINNAVKFQRAKNEKKKGMSQTAKDTEAYLGVIGMSLFDYAPVEADADEDAAMHH